MKVHKVPISCLLMVVLAMSGVSVAQTITQVDTIYTRDPAAPDDEEGLLISAGVYHEHPDATVLDRLRRQEVGLDNAHILRTDDGEANGVPSTEADLGDDCYQFLVDPTGIVRIERWNVLID